MSHPRFKPKRLIPAAIAVLIFSAILFFWDREPHYAGRPLDAWLQDCASQDDETRALAREILQQVGPEALPFLLNELRLLDGPWKIRVLEWLARHTPLKFDMDERGDRIEGALLALSAMGTNSAPAIPQFVRLLAKDPFFGAFCLNCVGTAARHHPAAIQAVPLLMKELGTQDPDLRDAVQGALRRIGPSAVPALTRAVTNTNETVRTRAAALLAEVGDAKTTAPKLIVLLRDPNSEVRRAAAGGLGRFGTQAAWAGPELLPRLQDPEPFVRLGAAYALAQMQTEEEKALEAVLATLNATNNELRVNGATTLRNFPGQAVRIIPILLGELTNSYARVESALAALQDTNNAATLHGLKWGEGYFRVNAMSSLRDLLAEAPSLAAVAMPVLLTALDDDQQWVRPRAVEALASIGSSAQPAVPRLIRLLREPDSEIFESAARALAQIAPDDPETSRALLVALQGSPPKFRAAAAEALGFCNGTDATVAGLTLALSDARHEVRLAAARSLGRLAARAAAARPALERAAEDPFPSVRTAARSALESMKKTAMP